MKRIWTVVFLVLMSVCAAVAQDAAGATTPSREDVLKFLELMQVRARMVQMTAGMKDGMKAGAEAGLKQKVPNPTPQQLKELDALLDPIFQDFPLDEMIDAIIPIYQKHLTKEDLDAAIAFYTSPAGQKILKEQPAMMSEAMKAGQDVMLRRIPELSKRMEAAIDKLAKEQSVAPASGTDSQPN